MEKPTLQLSGESGNSFVIVAMARKVLRRASYSKEKIEEFTEEAKSGDHDHVIQTCMKWFDVE